MPFHRFEDYEAVALTPHLSSGMSPIIEGRYLYYCLNQKEAGTGSELHYHPNELVIFTLEGKANAVVGKDRRIVAPGTMILIPPNVRHSVKATEDGPCAYLYIKDQTWTVVGIAADEARPDRPMSVDEVNEKYRRGELADRKGKATGGGNGGQTSDIIIEGVPNCYYPLLGALDEPFGAGRRIVWIEGERVAFGFYELPNGYNEAVSAAPHEYFYYVLHGALDAQVGNDARHVTAGGIIEVPKGAAYRLTVDAATPTRVAVVRSTDWLESRIGGDTGAPPS